MRSSDVHCSDWLISTPDWDRYLNHLVTPYTYRQIYPWYGLSLMSTHGYIHVHGNGDTRSRSLPPILAVCFRLARSIVEQLVFHSTSSGDGIKPASCSVCDMLSDTQCRACHQWWSSFARMCRISPAENARPASRHDIKSSVDGS